MNKNANTKYMYVYRDFALNGDFHIIPVGQVWEVAVTLEDVWGVSYFWNGVQYRHERTDMLDYFHNHGYYIHANGIGEFLLEERKCW